MGFQKQYGIFRIDKLSKKQKDCSFNLEMKGLNCATHCENEFTPEKRKNVNTNALKRIKMYQPCVKNIKYL